jgi:hypothetical protein
VTLSCEPLLSKAYGRRVADHLTAARADAWPVHARAGRLLMAGLHYRRGLLRSLGVDTALIEPERRVPVGHQRHINQQPVAPPIDSNCQIKKGQEDNA